MSKNNYVINLISMLYAVLYYFNHKKIKTIEEEEFIKQIEEVLES